MKSGLITTIFLPLVLSAPFPAPGDNHPQADARAAHSHAYAEARGVDDSTSVISLNDAYVVITLSLLSLCITNKSRVKAKPLKTDPHSRPSSCSTLPPHTPLPPQPQLHLLLLPNQMNSFRPASHRRSTRHLQLLCLYLVTSVPLPPLPLGVRRYRDQERG